MVSLQLTSNISRASMSSLSPSAEDIARLVLCITAKLLQSIPILFNCSPFVLHLQPPDSCPQNFAV